VSYPWIVWGQSPDPFTYRDFRLCVLNVQSGQTWVVNSARAEGQDPRATPTVDNGAIALDGTTLARRPLRRISLPLFLMVRHGAATAQSGLAWRLVCRAATLE
jgi:hypothetical protein